MSCGTKRIDRLEPPQSKSEKEWNARLALNTPQIINTITREEMEEINDYADLPDGEGRVG